VRRGNKARGQWTAFNNNVVSRFLTQKRTEQRGTWKVANEQSGAVEEKKKNLASHNRNVHVWKVSTQDQETATERKSECERCRKAWMSAGKIGTVPDETVGHIQSVQCVSQEEAVTAAHNQCWREIMEGITKHGSVKRSIKILERDKEQTLKTLWGEEKLNEFFSKTRVSGRDASVT
jgi:hypothetical protein